MNQPKHDKTLVKYLLGDLSEPERTAFEDRYFADDAFFEQLLVVEDELADSYVRGELSASEREHFERNLLSSPRQRERLEFARELKAQVSDLPSTRTATRETAGSWWEALFPRWGTQPAVLRWSLAALLLAMLLTGSWLLVQRLGDRMGPGPVVDKTVPTDNPPAVVPKQEVEQAQVSPPESNTPPLPQPHPRESADPRPPRGTVTPKQPTVASFALASTLVRGGNQPNRLLISPGTEQVQLVLDLEADEYPGYSVEIGTVAGKDILSRSKLRAHKTRSGPAVRVRLPARLLSAGDYLLSLKGVKALGETEEISEYYFKVVNR